MEYLIIGDQKIFYEIRNSTKARRISITVTNGQVKVSQPKGVAKKRVQEFVELKKDWILKHIEAYRTIKHHYPKKNYKSGELFLYRGREYRLEISFTEEEEYLKLDCNKLSVFIPINAPENQWSLIVRQAIINWYKDRAKELFKERLDHYCNQLDVEYKSFKIKGLLSRWGSCSAKGNINLNWKAIMAPDDAIDYLIVHELAHLKQMNHSHKFWELIASVMPEYEKAKRWLKDHQIIIRVIE